VIDVAGGLFRGIIFDAEGIVVDTEPVWDKAQERFLRERGAAYDRASVKHLLTGRSSLEATSVLKSFYGLEGDPTALDEERRSLMQEELSRRVSFVSGFEAFFAAVDGRYETCVATAMDGDLLFIVDQKLGLSSTFQNRVFTLEDVNHRSKADLFSFAAERIGVTPSEAVVIEDSPFGIDAAKRAGMTAIAMTTTHAPEQLVAADLVVASYAQLALAFSPPEPAETEG
jgi:beta-phosphoglucomutase-like phosphatase (HAD superfamily)